MISELNLLREKFTSENEKKITLARGANEISLDYQKLIKIKEESENKLNLIQNTIDEKEN